MAKPDALKEYAKTLYLTLDEHGEKAHSLMDIAKKCSKKCSGGKQNVADVTIMRWAKKGNWDDELEAKQAEVKKTLKNAYIERRKKELEDQLAAEAEEERKQTEDAEGLLDKAAASYVSGKRMVDRRYKDVSDIAMQKLQYNKMLLNRQKPDDLTWEEVHEMALTNNQLINLLNRCAMLRLEYDRILAEAQAFQDDEININITVIETVPVKRCAGQPKTIEGETL